MAIVIVTVPSVVPSSSPRGVTVVVAIFGSPPSPEDSVDVVPIVSEVAVESVPSLARSSGSSGKLDPVVPALLEVESVTESLSPSVVVVGVTVVVEVASVNPVVGLLEEFEVVFSSVFFPSVVMVEVEEETVSFCPPSVELVVSVSVEDKGSSVSIVSVEWAVDMVIPSVVAVVVFLRLALVVGVLLV